MNLWYIKQIETAQYLERPPKNRDTNYIPMFSDSVYFRKISEMNSVINLSYNDRVRSFINLYANQKRDQVEYMLGLSEYYFPIFEQILDYNGVPQELKYLSIIESALNPKAASHAGAVGLWQFIYSTGRMYGLKVDSYVDERSDPIKATHAAARFLKDLHGMFGDWVLVLAAYNCGPGNVKKAIRRSGGKTNYWEIYNYLPRETRGYVPAFIAAQYVMEHYKEHNLYPREIMLPMPVDTVMVTQKLNLKQVSEVLRIPFAQLKDINPQYRIGIIPNSTKGSALYLPADYAEKFIALQDSIVGYKDSIYLNDAHLVQAPPSYKSHKAYVATPPTGREKVYYTIKSGDNLGYLSQWFNVRISDIQFWNGMSSKTIHAGQKLSIYVSPDKKSYYKKFDSMSFSEKQASIGKSVPKKESPSNNEHDSSNDKNENEKVVAKNTKAKSDSKSENKNTKKSTGSYTTYTVKSGDSFWAIAKKFDGVTEQDIMKANGFSKGRDLNAGMKIKIPKK